MEERLQKLLSSYGVASRREAERIILAGRVRVNGNTASLGDKADLSSDVVEVDGKPLKKPPERVCLLLNKPRGYVTTCRDEKGRRTVAELVSGCPVRVYPVGRLDLSSEGLLLLTNDGELANRLTHPSGGTKKIYLAWVTGYCPGAEAAFQREMALDGKPLAPFRVRLRGSEGDRALLEVTLFEGRNRQVRRMCELAGLHVTRLKRIAEGPLRLGDLPPGRWRYVTEAEITALTET